MKHPPAVESTLYCGVWAAPGRFVAVPIDRQRIAHAPITIRHAPEACVHLLECLATIGVDTLIVTDRNAPIVDAAHRTRLHVYTASHTLVEAIRNAAGLNQRPLRHSAALLAGFALNPALRVLLRPAFAPAPQRQQLTLF